MTDEMENGASLPRAYFRVLAKRLIDAFRPASVAAEEQKWVQSLLTREEFGLWSRLSPYDQRHCVRVAQGVRRRLAATQYAGDSRWLSVALMHDIGKLESNLAIEVHMLATMARQNAKLYAAWR